LKNNDTVSPSIQLVWPSANWIFVEVQRDSSWPSSTGPCPESAYYILRPSDAFQ